MADDYLREKVSSLMDEEDYEGVIDLLEKMPARQRPYDLTLELAHACEYMAEYEPEEGEDPEEYAEDVSVWRNRALDYLGSIQVEGRSDEFWQYDIGTVLLKLGREGEARRHLLEAQTMGLDLSDMDEKIAACRRALSRPGFRKTYRQLTQEIWEDFLHNEEMARDMLSGKDMDGEEGAHNLCLDIFSPAMSSISVLTGREGDGYFVALSPLGKAYRIFPLVYVQQHAPKNLKNWNFHVGLPQDPTAALSLGKKVFTPDDIDVEVALQKDGRVSLGFFCKKLRWSIFRNRSQEDKIFEQLLRASLGEISFAANVGKMEVLTMPPRGNSVTLRDLPQELTRLGATFWPDGQSYAETFQVRKERKPDTSPEAGLRRDLEVLVSRYPDIERVFMGGTDTVLVDWHYAGITAGFVYFPMDPTEDAESRMAKLEKLEADLAKAAGQDVLYALGHGAGVKYGYLDLLLWDVDAALRSAEAFFRTSGLPWVSFHTFWPDTDSTPVWGKEPAFH